MIGKVLDTAAAVRVAQYLVTPIEKTDAFKLGLINADGKTIKKAKTAEEKKATNPLARMCWNLKRIIGMIPGGKTKIGSLAAAYLLMKEAYENEWSEEILAEQTLIKFENMCESAEELVGRELDQLLEDAPVNATGGATSTDGPAMRNGNTQSADGKKFSKSPKKPPVVTRAGTGPDLSKASI